LTSVHSLATCSREHFWRAQMPLALPAAALRRVFSNAGSSKKVDFKSPSPDAQVSPAAIMKTKSRTSRSLSPPLMTPTPSMASNASGVLLGSNAAQRKMLVLQHSWEEEACAKATQISDVYDVEEAVVGYGGYGTVRRATLRAAPTVVRAIKTVWKRNLKAESFVRGEIKILRRLDHPCICRLLETFEDEKAIYLVLEFIEGRELFDVIVEDGCLEEERAAVVMRQVFSALQYCHARNVMHRDLKPDNIMVQGHSHLADGSPTPMTPASTRAPEVKLIDFGLAVMTKKPVFARTGSAICGSAEYLAPEARKGTCLPASDVWSVGMVLHALLLGQLPEWRNEQLDLSSPLYDGISRGAKELIQSLLKMDPSKRLDAATAGAHYWTQGLAVRTPRDVTPTLASFVSFHRSAKLRRAALTALAMQLTSRQLSGLREQFLMIDTNGDGRISREELAMSVALSSPGGAAEDVRSFVESIFDAVYQNDGSQEIEYTEWLAAALQEGKYRSEEALRAAFRIFDADGDGNIDTADLGRVLSQTPEEVANFMPDFDSNGDGVIDFAEFKTIFEPTMPGGLDLSPILGGTRLSL